MAYHWAGRKRRADMDRTDSRAAAVDAIIRRHFGRGADAVGANVPVANSLVYPFAVAGQAYFLRLYESGSRLQKGGHRHVSGESRSGKPGLRV